MSGQSVNLDLRPTNVVTRHDEYHVNQDMNQTNCQSLNKDEPEYLDSFSEVHPLSSGRSLPPGKSQNNIISSDNSSKLRSLGYNRSQWTDHRSKFSEKKYNERCPNYSEPPHKVMVNVKGQEKAYMPYWGQEDNFPHYCKFVRSKTLHERTSTAHLITENKQHSEVMTVTRKVTRYRYKTRTSNTASKYGDACDSKGIVTTPCSSVNERDCLTKAGKEQEKAELSLSGGKVANAICTDDLINNSSNSKSATASDLLTLDNCKSSEDITGAARVKNKRVVQIKERKIMRTDKNRLVEITNETQDQNVQVLSDSDKSLKGTISYVDDVNNWVPELPTLGTLIQKNASNVRRVSKKQIDIPQQADKSANMKLVTDEEGFVVYHYYDVWSSASSTIHKSNGARVRLSPNNIISIRLQTSRFELPIDITSLESLSTQDYLRHYSTLPAQSQSMCLKMFNKYREKTGSIQKKHTLFKALSEVLVRTISREQENKMCDLLDIADETYVDFKLFTGMTAVAERLIITENRTLLPGGEEKQKFLKENIERADMYSLNWKLHNVQLNQRMRALLECLL